MSDLEWDPDRDRWLSERLRKYHSLLRYGEARNVREAVKMLATRRREWEADQATRNATRQRERHERRLAWGEHKYLQHKREAVLATGDPCFYCGDPNPRTVDHVIPNDDHRRKNLVPACSSCNAGKSTRTPDEWRAWRLESGLPWPPAPRVSRRPAIGAGLSHRKLTDGQVAGLRKVRDAALSGSFVELHTLTERSLRDKRLIEPTREYPVVLNITDRGRLALETGRVPR